VLSACRIDGGTSSAGGLEDRKDGGSDMTEFFLSRLLILQRSFDGSSFA